MYNIKLIRTDIRRNYQERAYLRLYESDAVPATYAAYMKMVQPEGSEGARQVWGPGGWGEPERKRNAGERILAPVGSSWDTAYKVFKQEFQDMTGYEWDDRMKALGTWPASTRMPAGSEKPWIYGYAKFAR
jgi:hypothetical protein